MRYSRTGIIAVLIAAELFIAGVIIVSAGGLHGVSWAGQTASYTPSAPASIDAGSRPHVVIDDGDSHVVVSASTDGKVHITDATRISGFYWGVLPAKLNYHRTPDGVVIEREHRTGASFSLIGMDRARTEVAVPPDATLEIVRGGGIDMTDLTGEISAKSEDGHISASNIHTAKVMLATQDGRITLDDVRADQIDAGTMDGSIHGSNLQTSQGRLHTSDGSIRVTLASGSSLKLHAQTGDGSITIDGERRRGLDSRSIDYTVGNGAGSLELSTADGSIHVSTNGA